MGSQHPRRYAVLSARNKEPVMHPAMQEACRSGRAAWRSPRRARQDFRRIGVRRCGACHRRHAASVRCRQGFPVSRRSAGCGRGAPAKPCAGNLLWHLRLWLHHSRNLSADHGQRSGLGPPHIRAGLADLRTGGNLIRRRGVYQIVRLAACALVGACPWSHGMRYAAALVRAVDTGHRRVCGAGRRSIHGGDDGRIATGARTG